MSDSLNFSQYKKRQNSRKELMPQSLSPSSLKKKVAFTLAEVLITLGIIGIVAAMTIPNLISKFQQHHWRAAYAKTYSNLTQAFKMMEEDGVDLSVTTEFWKGDNSYHSYDLARLFRELPKYFNATTLCFDNNADKCWVCETGQSGYYYSSAPDYLGCTKSSPAFIDASGVAYYLYSEAEAPFVIDVNGNHKPNRLGRDRFVFMFADSMDPSNRFASQVNTVIPHIDIIEKKRWCPDGECYYKTWLMRNK